MVCNVIPYTECKLEWINVPYKGYNDDKKIYVPWVCDLGNKTILHKKMIPKCFNVKRLNCIVELWKMDKNDNQVIAIT